MILTKDYFDENLALLKEHHHQAWQSVIDYAGEPMGVFQLAEDGNPNLMVRQEGGEEIFLHDNRDTLSELSDYYELVPENATGVAMFIGMGLGYTPPAMLQSRRQLRHMVVLEPEAGIFIQALHARDLASLFIDRRVSIAVGHMIDVVALLTPMGRALQLESFYILKHTPCFRIAPETYMNMYDEVFKYGNACNTGGNTLTVHGSKFIANRLRHLSAIHHQQLLEHLKDSFAGVPAIIVAGGPSLNKNIHLLPEAKGRAVIIAADTVLPALLAQGVTPDFTSCIDMDDITFEKIITATPDAINTSLVCSAWATSAVVKNFPVRQVYWTFMAQHMEIWLNQLVGGKIFTTGAGTVAHMNFLAACLLGCSPIVFVGQDLAFSEQSHALHTSLTTNDGQKSLFDRQEILWVDGYGGEKVPTSRSFLGFKHHFEQAMLASSDRQFINATEGGVRLDGTEELSLQEVLSRYCVQEIDVAAIIKNEECDRRMPGRTKMINALTRMNKDIGSVEKDMTSMDGMAAKITEEITKLLEQGAISHKFENLPVTMQRQLIALDAVNNRLDKAKVWTLLEEATREGLCLSERLNHELKELADQPGRYLEWLKGSMSRYVAISRFRRQVLAPFGQSLKHLCRNLKREEFLLKKLSKSKGHDRESVSELLRLYFENGDHVLLEKTIGANCPDSDQSAELYFYLGVIAAHRCQFEEMESNFSRVEELDSSWCDRISSCRLELAGRYLRFHREWQHNDRLVALRMLLKAVAYSSDHPELIPVVNNEIQGVLSSVLEGSTDLAELLVLFSRELTQNANLVDIVDPVRRSAVFITYGQVLFEQSEFSDALAYFERAAQLCPDVATTWVAIFEAAFNCQNFDRAVEALGRAVALDSSLAGHWEELGDLLFGAQNAADALAAYEQYFIAQPEQLDVLKKIGDCYMAMDQVEAAQETYRQLRERLA